LRENGREGCRDPAISIRDTSDPALDFLRLSSSIG
jgi:hypothetical protein